MVLVSRADNSITVWEKKIPTLEEIRLSYPTSGSKEEAYCKAIDRMIARSKGIQLIIDDHRNHFRNYIAFAIIGLIVIWYYHTIFNWAGKHNYQGTR